MLLAGNALSKIRLSGASVAGAFVDVVVENAVTSRKNLFPGTKETSSSSRGIDTSNSSALFEKMLLVLREIRNMMFEITSVCHESEDIYFFKFL